MTTTNSPGSCTCVRVQGDLDASTSPQLKARLSEAIAAGDVRLVVDLSAASFIDSSGLGTLVSALKNAKLNGGRLVLAGLQEQARLIFEVTMADRLFDIYATAEDAAGSF